MINSCPGEISTTSGARFFFGFFHFDKVLKGCQRYLINGCYVYLPVNLTAAKVPPTRMNLTTFKSKKLAAKKGYDLLKSKADALKVLFCCLLSETFLIFSSGSISTYHEEHLRYKSRHVRPGIICFLQFDTSRVCSRLLNFSIYLTFSFIFLF